MVSFRRRSGQATAVVLALAEQPTTWRYGYELCQRLDLKAGTLTLPNGTVVDLATGVKKINIVT